MKTDKSFLSTFLYPYQKKFVLDESKVIVWLKSRQIGGSFAIAFRCVYRAYILNKNQIIISTNQRNAAKVIKTCKKIIRLLEVALSKKIKLTIDNKLELKFANGAEITSLPNNPDTAIGYTGDLLIDEAARFRNDEELMEAILPFITLGYSVTLCSTPLGNRGFFYDYAQKAISGDKNFSLYRIDIWDAIKANVKGITRDTIELIQGEMDSDAFARNYLCKFIDAKGGYFSLDLINKCIDSNLENYTEAQLKKIDNLVAGLDLAKVNDSTVLTIVEKAFSGQSRIVYIKEFKKVSYSDQTDWINDFIRRIGCRRLYVDSTGVGNAVVEMLARKLGSIVCPTVFTNNSKELMISNLKMLMEKGQLLIPDLDLLTDQLLTLNRSFTSTGLLKFSHEKGRHDDAVWSLALAVSHTHADKKQIPIKDAVRTVKRKIKILK